MKAAGGEKRVDRPAGGWPEGFGLAPLAVVLGAVGIVSSLAVLGVPWLAWFERAWRTTFGWIALPTAFALVGLAAWLSAHRDDDPGRLPWGRVVALEVATLASLVLLGLDQETLRLGTLEGSYGGAGRIGWAFASAMSQAIGRWATVLVWLLIGMGGTLAALGYGGQWLAGQLESSLSGSEGSEDGAVARGGSDAGARPTPGRSTDVPGARATGGAAGDDDRHGERGGRGGPVGKRPESSSAAAGGPPSPVSARGLDPATKRPKKPARVTRGGGRASTARRVARGADLPEIDLLTEDPVQGQDDDSLQELAGRIEQTLRSLGVPADVVEIEPGPSVTRFGVVPGYITRGGERRRVPIRRIVTLRHDLALALSAPSIRIEAPVPGRSFVGIEVPNAETLSVRLRGLLQDRAFRKAAAESALCIALGRDVSGDVMVADLARMPHLLIAGSTGSGKSVCINVILASLLFQNTPDTLRLVLVDPKRVELSRFKGLPHLVASVVTDVDEVIGALRWLSAEMDRRYAAFAAVGARDLKSYNRKLASGEAPLAHVVVVIDELADLMFSAPEECEQLLTRLAQLARATGIHLVVATQRPSTDVITGLIKANFPARIAFAVSSATDSRVILDSGGAEALVGRGDMLFQPPDAPRPRRAQGALVQDDELERVIEHWKQSDWDAPPRVPPWDDLVAETDPDEALYTKALVIAQRTEQASASLLQRRLKIGWAKARELYERLEAEGIVGQADNVETDMPDDDLTWVDDEFGGA